MAVSRRLPKLNSREPTYSYIFSSSLPSGFQGLAIDHLLPKGGNHIHSGHISENCDLSILKALEEQQIQDVWKGTAKM